MPAHNAWLTLLLAASFMFALQAGVTSWRTACAWLGQPRRDLADAHRRHRDIWYLGAFFVCVSLLGTKFPLTFGRFSTLDTANLVQVEVIDLPDSWRTPEVARDAYRDAWCTREGLGMEICGDLPDADHPVPAYIILDREKWCADHQIAAGNPCASRFADLDDRFSADWAAERKSAIANLPKLDLTRRDLRLARGPFATLVGADLRWARLEAADLRWARLEGADLRWARLERTQLYQAQLEGADLVEARLEETNLWQARLEGANLEAARLEGAILLGARMEGADLIFARLDGTNLVGARLEGAELGATRLDGAILRGADFRKSTGLSSMLSPAVPAHFADFRGVQGLTQAWFEDMIGDAGTLLPDTPDPDTKQTFYIWSCWETPPADFDRIVATAAGKFARDDQREALRAEFLCGPDNPRRKTGTPLALDAPYPAGHPLADRDSLVEQLSPQFLRSRPWTPP